MPTARVIEAVDVLEDGGFGVATGFPRAAPDQLDLDGFEERLNGCIVIAVAFAAHPLPGSGCLLPGEGTP